MALPHARKLVVGGVSYEWAIKAPKDRYNLGWTPSPLRLLLKPEAGSLRTFECSSKHWTQAHEQDWGDLSGFAPAHKVPFGPGQVRQVIEGLPLLDWVVIEQV